MSSIAEVQVSAGALKHNLAALRALCPEGMKVAAVVKANAYGHGLAEVVPVLEPLVDAFQVDDFDELYALRKVTAKRALVLGYVPSRELLQALALGCELTVFDTERLGALAEAAAKLELRAKVHIEVDALLGRLGVRPNDVEGLVQALKGRPEIEVVSAYGHYANIEDTTDPSHAICHAPTHRSPTYSAGGAGGE